MKRPLIALAAAAALALAASACGGSDDGGAGSSARVLPASTADAATIEQARKRGYLNESSPPGEQGAATEALAQRPCDLVSAAQARKAFGAPVRKPVEGRQGPTCIYRTRSGKGFLTLAVQSASAKQLGPVLDKAKRVAVSGRKGYCSREATLYVPLSGGRTLTIGGVPARPVPGSRSSCELALDFAAEALAQLAR